MNRRQLEHHLRRCSARDRAAVIAIVDDLDRQVHNIDAMRRYRKRQDEDLRVIVADQRRHIANLEAQLLPYITAPAAEQDALL